MQNNIPYNGQPDWLEKYKLEDIELRKYALRCALDFCAANKGEDIELYCRRFLTFLYGLAPWDGMLPSERMRMYDLEREISSLKRELTKIKKATVDTAASL